MLLRPLHHWWWRKKMQFCTQGPFGPAAIAAHKDAAIESSGPREQCMAHPVRGYVPHVFLCDSANRGTVEVPESSSCGVHPDTSLPYRHFPSHVSNSSHFSFQHTIRMRPFKPCVSLQWPGRDQHQTPTSEGCFIKYFIVMCKWGIQARWPGSQDFVFLHGNGNRFPSGSLHLFLDFDYKHL